MFWTAKFDRPQIDYDVVTKIYYEDNLAISLEDYEISVEDAASMVKYCSSLECQKDERLIRFCGGCILRTLQDEWGFNRENAREFSIGLDDSKLTISKDNEDIFVGSIEELEEDGFGLMVWMFAKQLESRYFNEKP